MNKIESTFLEHLHHELDAKMTDFAGFKMPIHYPTGIIVEHLHTRNHAGFFDLSHMGQIAIYGRNAQHQLNALVPSDLSKLKTGQQKYTVFTNANGGILDDIVVSHLGDYFLIIGNAVNRHKNLEHLQAHLDNTIRIQELNDRALLAIQGPNSADIMKRLNLNAAHLSFMSIIETELYNSQCLISRSGYTGEDGFEISIEHQHAETLARLLLAEDTVRPIGLGARNTLRLEAGLCLFGNELNESITPIDAGLQWLIAPGKSDYIGSKTLLEKLRRPQRIKRIGLCAEGKIPVRERMQIYNNRERQIGYISSGSYSPCLKQPIAMGYIETGDNTDSQCYYALVRSKRIRLHRTQLPFVEHNYFKP